MLNLEFKNRLTKRVLPRVIQPAQYFGGELNMVRKDHHAVNQQLPPGRPPLGKLCLAFPDTYTIGMSHHGLQVLYTLMNADPTGPASGRSRRGIDMEADLRAARPAALQPGNVHAACTVRRARLHAAIRNLHAATCSRCSTWAASRSAAPDRTMDHPLVIAGGPCAQNPEPLAPFIDLFVTGDGEPSLPRFATSGCNAESANVAAGLWTGD